MKIARHGLRLSIQVRLWRFIPHQKRERREEKRRERGEGFWREKIEERERK